MSIITFSQDNSDRPSKKISRLIAKLDTKDKIRCESSGKETQLFKSISHGEYLFYLAHGSPCIKLLLTEHYLITSKSNDQEVLTIFKRLPNDLVILCHGIGVMHFYDIVLSILEKNEITNPEVKEIFIRLKADGPVSD